MLYVLSSVALALVASTTEITPCSQPAAPSWAFKPSYFSHDPTTGQRVIQYASPPPVYAVDQGDFFRSGYRVLNGRTRGAGGGVDRQIIVESWGNGRGLRDAQFERDYGAWRGILRAQQGRRYGNQDIDQNRPTHRDDYDRGHGGHGGRGGHPYPPVSTPYDGLPPGGPPGGGPPAP